jgi:hypothetical protein
VTTPVPTTEPLLAATETALRIMREHHLYARALHVDADGLGEGERRARIQLFMYSQPGAFLEWCRFLKPGNVFIERREHDTCLHLWRDFEGFTWSINGAVTRRLTKVRGLPGITIDWIRQPSGRPGDTAWVPRADFERALSGVLAEALRETLAT